MSTNEKALNAGVFYNKRWRKYILLLLVVPLVVAAIIGSIYAIVIYADNRIIASKYPIPSMQPPQPSQSLLIFAPHCDDESLGAAGLIYQATHNGSIVHAVIFSNGDGFRIGVSRHYNIIKPVPADFIRYGYKREKESLTALNLLGVPSENVTFLGYPDRGLMPMWTSNWDASQPYTSPYTQANHNPYNNVLSPGRVYAGCQVLDDVVTIMEKVKPTDIFVTHPSDDHPDHSAASVFVRTALEQCRLKRESWALSAKLHYYLVHRGDWPVPQGLNEDAVLPPPAQMIGGETTWQELHLTHYQVQRKYAAIKRYRSQTEVTGRFLFSFARKNELFGTIQDCNNNPIQYIKDNSIQVDGNLNEWYGIPPVAIDPIGDSVGRAVQGSADISKLYMVCDHRNLYVRLDVKEPLSKQVVYGISLRPIRNGQAQQPQYLHLTVKPIRENAAMSVPDCPGAIYAWHKNAIEMQIPIILTGLKYNHPGDTINVAADTQFTKLIVDKTGYHCVSFSAPQSKLADVKHSNSKVMSATKSVKSSI